MSENGGLWGEGGQEGGEYCVMSCFIIRTLVCTGCCGGDHYNREKYAELVYIAPVKISNA